MITLTNITKLETLPISSALKTFLHNQLIQTPFDTPDAAKESWQALDNHCLTLSITDQAGSGLYLLFPCDTQCPELTRWMEDT